MLPIKEQNTVDSTLVANPEAAILSHQPSAIIKTSNTNTSTEARRQRRNLWSLVAICVLAYTPMYLAVALGAWPFGEDSVAAFGVWREFAREALWRGILPLWNPHIFCGQPFMSNGQTAILYPVNILYWLAPVRIAMLLDAVVHNIWLAFGSYALARALRLSRTASWMVAVCLALSGSVAGHIFNGHMTWHAARGYLPWELWSLLCYLRCGQRRYVWLLVGFFVLQLNSGYPPIALLSAALCFGLIIAWIVSHRSSHSAIGRTILPRNWPVITTLAALLTVTISAVYILPLREVSQLSVHGTGLPYHLAMFGSGNWHSLVRLILPDFFGGNHDPQWSIDYVSHEEGAYLGLIFVILAVGAPFFARQRAGRKLPRAVLWLWVLAAIALVFAMGENTPVYPWLYHNVGLFRLMRVSVRWMELWLYPAALLAGFGLDSVLHRAVCGDVDCKDRASSHQARILTITLAVVFLIFLFVLLWILTTSPRSALWMQTAQWNVQRTPSAQIIAAEILRWSAIKSLLMGLVLAGLGVGFLYQWQKVTAINSRRLFEKLLLGLILIDVMGAFWRSIKVIPPRQLRDKVFWPAHLTQSHERGQRWVTQLSLNSMNQGMPLGIDLFSGYDTMGGHRFFNYASAVEGYEVWFAAYQPARNSPLLRVAGVTHTLKQRFLLKKATEWQLIHHQGAWPRVYLTRDVRRLPAIQQLTTLEALVGRAYSAKAHPVVVSPQAFNSITGSPLKPADKALSWTRDLNYMAVETQATAPAVLVQSEAWYPGWTAWVNGKPTALEPANYLFRAVLVPAGKSRVAIAYEPSTYRFSLFVSLCGIAVVLSMAAWWLTSVRSKAVRDLTSL